MELPSDAAMLLSVINLKLRDFYASLDELCEALDVDKEEITKKLKEIDYEYDAKQNRFL